MYSQRALERLLPFDNVADMSEAQESRVERGASRVESTRKLEDSLPTFHASPPGLRAVDSGWAMFFVAPFDCVNMQKWSHYSI